MQGILIPITRNYNETYVNKINTCLVRAKNESRGAAKEAGEDRTRVSSERNRDEEKSGNIGN